MDLEQDCPPFMDTYRGMEEGFPRLLDLFAQEGVPATFFTTGDVAERYPAAVRALVERGHELGCHGLTHAKFTGLGFDGARHEIDVASRVLRTFAPVTSFRAPNLAFPDRFLELLEQAGYAVDSSRALYKLPHYFARGSTPQLHRLPVSMTSSVLRLSPRIRDPWLAQLKSPVVLFVHPWEFVDLRASSLRLDCRFNTGDIAVQRLREVIHFFQTRHAQFHCVAQAASLRAAA